MREPLERCTDFPNWWRTTNSSPVDANGQRQLRSRYIFMKIAVLFTPPAWRGRPKHTRLNAASNDDSVRAPGRQ
jgi:hypothetical protein